MAAKNKLDPFLRLVLTVLHEGSKVELHKNIHIKVLLMFTHVFHPSKLSQSAAPCSSALCRDNDLQANAPYIIHVIGIDRKYIILPAPSSDSLHPTDKLNSKWKPLRCHVGFRLLQGPAPGSVPQKPQLCPCLESCRKVGPVR